MHSHRTKSESSTVDWRFTFATSGILLLSSSHGAYFATGSNIARYAMLLLGFLSIVGAAALGAKALRGRDIVRGAAVAMGAALLAMQAWALKQDLFEFPVPVFHAVCIALLFAGYALGNARVNSVRGFSGWALVPAAIVSIVCLFFMWRFLGSVGVSGAERSYGDTELNPISVAYYNSVLFTGYSVLMIGANRMIPRAVFGVGAGLSALMVATSGSRGAVIWVLVTALVFAPILARRVLAGAKQLTLLGGALAIAGLGGFVLAKGGGDALERVDVLVKRSQSLYYSITEGEADISTNARELMWGYYTRHPQVAWPFGEAGYAGYPHNQYIELYARFGLVGLVFALLSLLLFSRILLHVWRTRRDPDWESIVLFSVFVFAYLQSMTSMSLEMNRVLWLGFGYFLGSPKRAIPPAPNHTSHGLGHRDNAAHRGSGSRWRAT